MKKSDLRKLLQDAGLGVAAERILTLSRPAIEIDTISTDDAKIPTGASKMGGLPDLPSGVAWPMWHVSMAFIGQFNLAEVAPFDQEHLLPTSGLLSFFYETDGEPLYSHYAGLPDGEKREIAPSEEHRAWKVLYSPGDPSAFTRREKPQDVSRFFSSCSVRLDNTWSLPDYDDPRRRVPFLMEWQTEILREVELQIYLKDVNREVQQLLGNPFGIHMSPVIACYSEAQGQDAYLRWRPDLPNSWKRSIDRRAFKNWRLLFQVTGSTKLDMGWADGGIIYYCIDVASLRKHDFSKVWLDMQFA